MHGIKFHENCIHSYEYHLIIILSLAQACLDPLGEIYERLRESDTVRGGTMLHE